MTQDFITEAVLKRDLFSETHKGHFAGDPGRQVIRRIVTASPIWTRPIAWTLAKREIAALRAVKAVPGVTQLIATDRHGLFRTWTEGAPLHLARPGDRTWYLSAFRLLRALRRAGLTHNDLAKPQNWLSAPDGSATVIDFQLASRHRRRGAIFRWMAYEDFRHLLKQQRAFAPNLLTPTARRILDRRSWPSRVWRATVKRVYNAVTRNLLNWSDAEGTFDRLDHEGPAIVAAAKAFPGVRDIVLTVFPLPGKGVGLYAFVEVTPGTDAKGVAQAVKADYVQCVAALPRADSGAVRLDLLELVAMNRMPELQVQLAADPELVPVLRPIADARLNFSDRRVNRLEPAALTPP